MRTQANYLWIKRVTRITLFAALLGAQSIPLSAETKLPTIANLLTQLQHQLDDTATTRRRDSSTTVETYLEALKQQFAGLETLKQQQQAYFEQIETHILNHQLPTEVLQRHQEQVAQFQNDWETLAANLQALIQADSSQLRRRTATTLEQLQPQTLPQHAPADNLYIPQQPVRPPLQTPEALKQFLHTPIQVAATTLPAGLLRTRSTSPAQSELAASEIVQLTEDIKKLAQSLNHNPVEIYHWVYNHIQFVPTYGAIQGAQMTLQSQQGNAFDTTSLLIALLRAANIHARYVYGSVQIPIDKIMNWLGDLKSAEAAIQLLNQGGIPASALTQGGKIIAVTLEHVWAEAFVDFFPSRGAKHQQGDSWVPLDASFKQYQFSNGLALAQNVAFQAQNFIDEVIQNSRVDEVRGLLRRFDHQYIETSAQNYQTQLEQYIQQQGQTQAQAILGSQQILVHNPPVLAADLPYQIVARGDSFAELPESLQRRFQFSLYSTEANRVLDKPLFNFTASLAALAGKKITLLFKPASDTDQAVIQSFLPVPAPGTTIDLSQLPQTLPGYLVRLTAQLHVDDDIVHTTGSFMLGQLLSSRVGLTQASGEWYFVNNQPVAGALYAIGLNLQAISRPQLQQLQQQLATTQAALAAQQFDSISSEQLVADVLHAALLNYFVTADLQLKVLNRLTSAVAYRQPSVGSLSTYLQSNYQFGVPQEVKVIGFAVDMDILAQSLWTQNNQAESAKTFTQHLGAQMSAWQHRFLAAYLKTNETQQAVSAVKALVEAVKNRQLMFEVTSNNVNLALRRSDIDAVMAEEIRTAVAAGKQAILSQDNVQLDEWLGRGYVILTPKTGLGRYKISDSHKGSLLPWPTPQAVLLMTSVWLPPATIAAIDGTTLAQLASALLTQGNDFSNVLLEVAAPDWAQKTDFTTLKPFLTSWLMLEAIGTGLNSVILVNELTGFILSTYVSEQF